jgi:glycine oxidase
VGPARVESVGVVGGGVIGLSIAFELACEGLEVTVIDPSPGRGASWAAAGMLAPASEVAPGEESLVADLAEAASRWPQFATRIKDVGGSDVGFRETGSVLVGATPSDAREVTRMAETMRTAGVVLEPLDGEELVRREPTLAASMRSAWLLPGDHSVDNRRLVTALLEALKALGTRLVEDSCVRVVAEPSGIRLVLEGQGEVRFDRCVLATGAAQPVEGTHALGLPSVRPVRGMALRLGAVEDVVIPTRSVRAVVDGTPCYLVPRSDGSLVVGATSEEQGRRTIALAGGVHDLLAAARAVFPGVDELSFEEASVGLRPATPDHLPFVGNLADPRVIAALGHYRNGVLLAPLTGARVTALVKQATCA